jgi:hypothetical protein
MQGWPGPLARPAGLPARLSGARGGKRSPQANRAPHPFRPAGRRTVRASGPCHPGLQPLANAGPWSAPARRTRRGAAGHCPCGVKNGEAPGITTPPSNPSLAKRFQVEGGRFQGARTDVSAVLFERVGALGWPCPAGLETCATTLECLRVSRRMVARLQRWMATVAANPGRCPGLSCGGLSGLSFGPSFRKRKGKISPLTEQLRGCATMIGRAKPKKCGLPAMRGSRAEARAGAVDEASTAAREGACAPRDQPRQRMAG